MFFKILVVGRGYEEMNALFADPGIRFSQVGYLSQAPHPADFYHWIVIEHPLAEESASMTVRQFFPTPSAPAPLVLVFADDVERAREELGHLKHVFIKEGSSSRLL